MSTKHAGGPPPRARSATRGAPRKSTPVLRAAFTCASPSSYGEIVVLEPSDRSSGFVVAWRRDRRFRRKLTVLTAIGDGGHAISSALSLSSRYVPPSPPLPNRPRDSQRGVVYEWERELPQGRKLTSPCMQALADQVCRHFGVTPVPVHQDRRLTSSSFFSPSRGIAIADGMNDEATLWHELAHYLIWKMAIVEPSHGPAFVATLIGVRSLFGGFCHRLALAAASTMRIEVNLELLDGLLGWRKDVAAA